MRIQTYFGNAVPMPIRTPGFLTYIMVITLLASTTLSLFASPPLVNHGLDCNSFYKDNGGFVVVMTGLMDESIVLEFGDMETSKNAISVQVSIYADDGTLVHELNTASPFVDFKGLALASGNYTLIVKVNSVSLTITFSL